MAVKPYADTVKKLKKGAEADKIKKIAADLDADRAKGKKDPFGHMQVHAKLLKAKEKELAGIKKSLGKKDDKDLAKAADSLAKEIKAWVSKLSQKPKSLKT